MYFYLTSRGCKPPARPELLMMVMLMFMMMMMMIGAQVKERRGESATQRRITEAL